MFVRHHRLQVIRVNARPLPTKMMQMLSVWDRPVGLFPSYAVGASGLPLDLDAGVAVDLGPGPDVARRVVATILLDPPFAASDSVAADEAIRLTFDLTQRRPRLWSQVRLSTAAALAIARSIVARVLIDAGRNRTLSCSGGCDDNTLQECHDITRVPDVSGAQVCGRTRYSVCTRGPHLAPEGEGECTRAPRTISRRDRSAGLPYGQGSDTSFIA